MAWMQSEKDLARIRGLRGLEDRRVAFAERLAAQGLSIDQALLVQAGGGFEGIALSKGAVYLLTGPAPGDADGEYLCEPLADVRLGFEPFLIESEGMGGVLGMGKKGGAGYKLVLEWADDRREIEFVPALQNILEVREGEPFPLTQTRRSKKDYNFVWDFRAIDLARMDKIAQRWLRLVNQI